MLARVTPKAVNTMPGIATEHENTIVSSRKEEVALATSNSYTISENLLLRWLNYHVNATMPPLVKIPGVCDLEKDLQDGAILCHVLVSHVPKLTQPGMPLEEYFGASKVSYLPGSTTLLKITTRQVSRHHNFTEAQ